MQTSGLNSFWKLAIFAVLFVSCAITFGYSALTPSTKAPDERHHFAYGYGIYQQNFNPLFNRSKIFTSGDAVNHLRHPPAYYYLVAATIGAFNLDKDFPKNLSSMRAFDSQFESKGIPIVRNSLLFLYAIYLVGIYAILKYLVQRGYLNGAAAVGGALLTTFIPSRMFVAGAVSNDALILAIWPFLFLSGIKALLEKDSRALAYFLALAALSALTKLTLAVAAVPLSLALLFCFFTKPRDFLKSAKGPHFWTAAAICILLTAAASLYYGSAIAQFGTPNPTYAQIYGIKHDKFNNGPAEIERSFFDIGYSVLTGSTKSTVGILGRGFLYSDADPASSAALIFVVMITGLLISLSYLLFKRNIQSSIPFILISTTFFFYIVWINWNVNNWELHSRLGTQGRYTIGALEVGIIGCLTAFYWLPRWTKISAIFVSFTLMAAVLFDPFLYARHNQHIYFAAGGPSLIPASLISDGFKKLSVQPLSPAFFVKRGFRKSSRRTESTNFWVMEPHSKIRLQLALNQPFMQVAVWMDGQQAERQVNIIAGNEDKIIHLSRNISVTLTCLPTTKAIQIEMLPVTSGLLRIFDDPHLLGVWAKGVKSCP
ncbi:glycosyltransferase family 39 protein [Corticibacterium sp. UT-5YL-CI-8]|nr:glycosyltransferase family 39 protein [Tianweitania sp. UT-5YL-CI-8]